MEGNTDLDREQRTNSHPLPPPKRKRPRDRPENPLRCPGCNGRDVALSSYGRSRYGWERSRELTPCRASAAGCALRSSLRRGRGESLDCSPESRKVNRPHHALSNRAARHRNSENSWGQYERFAAQSNSAATLPSGTRNRIPDLRGGSILRPARLAD